MAVRKTCPGLRGSRLYHEARPRTTAGTGYHLGHAAHSSDAFLRAWSRCAATAREHLRPSAAVVTLEGPAIGGLLDLTDRLIEALESHERPSAEQLDALRVHAWTGGSNSIACGNGWRV